MEIFDQSPPVEPSTAPNMNEALICQMQHEKTNYYTYLNFAGQCDCKGLLGAAKFFRKQSLDEMTHFNKFFDYLCDRVGFVPELRDIPSMGFDYNMCLVDMIRASLQLEQLTTAKLTIIKRSALELTDYMTDSFLDWFILEQIEEEKQFSDLLNRCKMFGDSPAGIMLLDQELGNI